MPDAIKAQYQSPPSMLLPAGVRQLELICGSVPDHQPSERLTTEAEQEEVGPRRTLIVDSSAAVLHRWTVSRVLLDVSRLWRH